MQEIDRRERLRFLYKIPNRAARERRILARSPDRRAMADPARPVRGEDPSRHGAGAGAKRLPFPHRPQKWSPQSLGSFPWGPLPTCRWNGFPEFRGYRPAPWPPLPLSHAGASFTFFKASGSARDFAGAPFFCVFSFLWILGDCCSKKGSWLAARSNFGSK